MRLRKQPARTGRPTRGAYAAMPHLRIILRHPVSQRSWQVLLSPTELPARSPAQGRQLHALPVYNQQRAPILSHPVRPALHKFCARPVPPAVTLTIAHSGLTSISVIVLVRASPHVL